MPPLPPPDLNPSGDAPPGAGDDLAWVAFGYVTDALTPREAIRFERRLARDQTARAALASAVDLAGALAIVAREEADQPTRTLPIRPRRSRRFSGRVVVLVGGLASAAAVVLALIGLSQTLRPGTMGPTIEVALAWIDLRSAALTSDPATFEPAPVEAATGGELAGTESDAGELADVPAEQPVPSWILAAVPPPADSETPQPEGN